MSMSRHTIKLSSWNVNGIRACIKKGFWDWFDKTEADIVCLQETKITQKDFEKIAAEYHLISIADTTNEQIVLFDNKPSSLVPRSSSIVYYALATAKKAGYSGVLLLSKIKPRSVTIGLGDPRFDDEGRTIVAHYDDFVFVGCYFPNGGSELERIPYKMQYNEFLLQKLESLREEHKHIVVCGDMNVAHTEIDIKNPKANENNSGFTKTERDWFSQFLSHKYVDVFRHKNPDARHAYTWWSYRPGVRQNNIGWRIDYFVVTEEMLSRVDSTGIQADQMGSDHCPVHLTIN
ncbi:MAG: hypothetical protein ACD_62C00127G0006 [uncultured bacterium]|nr:MAG: hypothetical protein ACD_62C00127G0006 [uncultured bacterium]